MAKGIMRYYKRHWQSLKRLEAEANRSKEDHTEKGVEFQKSMVKWDKTDDNFFLKKTTGWRDYIDTLCAERNVTTRADSVCMIDTLYTASPEWLDSLTKDEQKKYFEKCLDYHIKTFCSGDPELVVNAVIHRDESGLHMHVASVPLIMTGKKTVKWRLNAKNLLRRRKQYRERQESFWQEVARPYGLEHHKLKESTKRDHIESNQFHAENAKKAKEEMEQAYNELQKVYDEAVRSIKKEMKGMEDKINELDSELERKTSQEYQDEYKRQVMKELQKELQAMVNIGKLDVRAAREWKILQDKFPEVAKRVNEINIQMKKDGTDKGNLPVSSGIKTKSKTKAKKNEIGGR